MYVWISDLQFSDTNLGTENLGHFIYKKKINTTVNVRNPNIQISDNAEIRTIDRSRWLRSDFGRSGLSLSFEGSDFSVYSIN